jgi:peptidoglycan/LPS O-acetylase OafA/YrhL
LLGHIGAAIDNPIGLPFGIPHFYYVTFGGVAVTLFLIISGAILQLKYGNGKYKYLQFLTKRFSRIYPIYYISLLFGIAVYCLRSWYFTGNLLSSFSRLKIEDIILSITGSYAFVGKWGGPFNDASWYIALIISMYILFPFLSVQIKRKPRLSIAILFLISFVSRSILGVYKILPYRPLDWFPLCRIFEFSLGIYLAVILHRALFYKPKLSFNLNKFIYFVSELSFPLFLIHYPFLFMIRYLTEKGINQILAICFYLAFSIILSWLILIVDKKIPRYESHAS